MQYKILSIKLNITYGNEATICFECGILLSLISTIQVNISVDTTNVHVVDISTLLFLCLKDMDILGIYLNNITNQLICQDGKNVSII